MAHLFIIAGHGAGDPGACANGFSEAERVRALAMRIKALGGEQVTLGDFNRDYYADNGISSLDIPADWQITELHMDSAAAGAKGGHVIIKAGFDPDQYDNALASFIGGVLPGRSNLIVGRDDLANPNRAAARGYSYRLVEVGFITNTGDLTIFNNQMDGIARGILEAFGIKSNAEPPKPKTPLWYQAHVSGKGWMDAVNGGIAGTVGQNRALEAIKIDTRKLNFKIKARAHIQNIGLKDFGYIKHDTVIGTTGKGLEMEAIELIAEGLNGKKLQTRVHIQDIGWTRWTSGMIGTVGMNRKIEAIELRLV